MLSDAHSWINSHLANLVTTWRVQGHEVSWAHSLTDAQQPSSTGRRELNLCFCLSFSQLLPAGVRSEFDHTLVVHASNLPQGKGWSPLTWQILEGKQRIPVTLIEAAERVDSGKIYAQEWLTFQGNELIDELRSALATATNELCRSFVDNYPHSVEKGQPQTGVESFYPRRRPADSRLDPDRTLAEQFDLLRVVDNQRYPAFFEYRGRTYILQVSTAPTSIGTNSTRTESE